MANTTHTDRVAEIRRRAGVVRGYYARRAARGCHLSANTVASYDAIIAGLDAGVVPEPMKVRAILGDYAAGTR